MIGLHDIIETYNRFIVKKFVAFQDIEYIPRE